MAQNKIESQIYKKALNKAYLNLLKDPSMNNVLDVYSICEYLLRAYPRYYKECFVATDLCKKLLAEEPMFKKDKSLQKLWWQIIFLEGTNKNVDSGLIYLERYREPEKQFYLPRRETFTKFGIIQALQDLVDDKIDLLAISTPPRAGKALANDTPIFTPDGWKKHGDLKVGDRVYGMNGEIKKVIAVHPKCMLDRKITFTNGEEIICHENHSWLLYDRSSHKEKIFETKKIEMRKLDEGKPNKRGHRYNLQLPLWKSIKGEKKDLPLEPYVLGVWLGDGVNTNPTICGDKNDYAVIERIVNLGYRIRWQTTHKTTGVKYYGFDIRKQLQQYGMCHSRRRTEKHIPMDYLTASYEQRLDLLAGLIDTDGTYNKRDGRYFYTTSDIYLRDSFVDLINTFGWRVGMQEIKPRLSTSKIQGKKKYWVIRFVPDVDIPLTLERKRRTRAFIRKKIGVKSIEKIKAVEGNCITVEGDGMYLCGKTMIPTHNSTLKQFFEVLLGGWYPNKQVFSVSYSQSIVNMFYNGYLSMITDKHTYSWQEMFGKNTKLQGNNAKDTWVNLGDPKNFKTFTARSIDGTITGSIQAGILLSCDDLVKNIEEAMNKNALAKIYTKYSTDLIQRKIKGAKELHIATRWSVWDVIGRIEQNKQNDDRARFIRVPALDKDGNSNFNYPNTEASFDTKYYLDIQNTMDAVSFNCLYMQEPVEREGLLFESEKMRRYFERPDTEPDKIWATCDTKDKGSDFVSMPIAYQYGEDFYIEDVVFTDSTDYDLVDNELASKLIEHKVNVCRFESNNAGGRVASDVQKILDERKARISLQTKFTRTNKETKILTNSDWIMKHCLFKDDSKMTKQYKDFYTQLITYTAKGKNPHDDSPDSCAMLSEFVASGISAPAEIMRSPI